MKIYCATKLRGFQRHLFEHLKTNHEIEFRSDFYEVNSSLKNMLSKAFRTPVGDLLGLILVPKAEQEADLYFSYNRFLKTNNTAYVINLENPTALYHYSLNRIKYKSGRNRIKKLLESNNIKAIVCISKACFTTFEKLLPIENMSIPLFQIYPMIPDQNLSRGFLRSKSYRNILKCLFVSSEFNLKSGNEVITLFEKFQEEKFTDIEITIITKKDKLTKTQLERIGAVKAITLKDFNLDFSSLTKEYQEASVLIHATRQDSFGLVILEAIKSGLVVLATNLYAIPEMVKNNINGFLTEPKFRFFDVDNLPNSRVWNNRSKTIYSDFIDDNIVTFLYNKLLELHSNREKLYQMAYSSFELSLNEDFSENSILVKWNELLASSEKLKS